MFLKEFLYVPFARDFSGIRRFEDVLGEQFGQSELRFYLARGTVCQPDGMGAAHCFCLAFVVVGIVGQYSHFADKGGGQALWLAFGCFKCSARHIRFWGAVEFHGILPPALFDGFGILDMQGTVIHTHIKASADKGSVLVVRKGFAPSVELAFAVPRIGLIAAEAQRSYLACGGHHMSMVIFLTLPPLRFWLMPRNVGHHALGHKLLLYVTNDEFTALRIRQFMGQR